MTCANCGKPIAQCELGELTQDPPCYYHTISGYHRCDGLPEDHPALVAMPKEVA